MTCGNVAMRQHQTVVDYLVLADMIGRHASIHGMKGGQGRETDRPVLRLDAAVGFAKKGSEGGSCTVMKAKSPMALRSLQSSTIPWYMAA